jgi:hypothetical protein
MTFQDAEKAYKDLQAQHSSGKLNDASFEVEVGKLRLQDAQGRWWQIGVQTGEWYMHDGQKWNKAKPPTTAQAIPAVEAAVVPEIVHAATPSPASRVAAPKPAASKPDPVEKKEPGSALPARLFSPKPATRNGGLPPAAIIAIVVVVALLGIALLVGGFMWMNQTKGNIVAGLSGTVTPTRGLFVPSPALPTLPPTLVPTETAVFPPTPVVTATIPLVPTPVHTVARVVATPTKKPAAAAPASSPTPNVPPGIYVVKLETDPSKISIGDALGFTFKMTMFNNTGGIQVYKKWFVRVFSCPEQCSGDNAFKGSFGESPKMTDVNIAAGTSAISTGLVPPFGAGRCDYTAIPYYIGDNEIAIPFLKTNGQPLYYSFKVCQ